VEDEYPVSSCLRLLTELDQAAGNLGSMGLHARAYMPVPPLIILRPIAAELGSATSAYDLCVSIFRSVKW
jgi:hypothetical protein